MQGAGSNVVKHVEAIYPVFTGSGTATVKMKYFQTPQTSIDWTTPDQTLTFDIDTNPDFKITPHSRARYLAMQITTNNSVIQNLCHFGFDIKPSASSG